MDIGEICLTAFGWLILIAIIFACLAILFPPIIGFIEAIFAIFIGLIGVLGHGTVQFFSLLAQHPKTAPIFVSVILIFIGVAISLFGDSITANYCARIAIIITGCGEAAMPGIPLTGRIVLFSSSTSVASILHFFDVQIF